MNQTKVLQVLEQHKDELVRRYGIVDIALFGSTVRNTAHQGSDIGILVAFDRPANSARHFGVQFYGRLEKPVIPAKAGIQAIDLTGSPPARGRRTGGFSRCPSR